MLCVCYRQEKNVGKGGGGGRAEELISSGGRRTERPILIILLLGLLLGISAIIVPIPIRRLAQCLVIIQRPTRSTHPRPGKAAGHTLSTCSSKMPPGLHDVRSIIQRKTLGVGAREREGRGFVEF